MKDVFVIIHVCVVVVFQHPMEDNIQLILNLYEVFDMMIPMKIFVVCDKRKVRFEYFKKNKNFFFRFLEYMHKLLTEFSQANTVPLRLNHDSPLYKTFAT
jgi:hypothetical protein